jgi:hypothetical protein
MKKNLAKVAQDSTKKESFILMESGTFMSSGDVCMYVCMYVICIYI